MTIIERKFSRPDGARLSKTKVINTLQYPTSNALLFLILSNIQPGYYNFSLPSTEIQKIFLGFPHSNPITQIKMKFAIFTSLLVAFTGLVSSVPVPDAEVSGLEARSYGPIYPNLVVEIYSPSYGYQSSSVYISRVG